MAITVDELVVEIKAETQGLRRGLQQVDKSVKQVGQSTEKSLISFRSFAKIAATIGLGRIASEGVSTIRTFQDLEASLKAITGSAANAATSIDLIRKFTSGTTFQLENVTTAFTTLLNAGIAPTSDTLMDFGNLAAAFGKDITTIAQAAFNATTGEMEMLKQFGIKAKLDGDKIEATFQGVTTTIGRNADEITGFLRSIGRERFPTALEETANTLSGRISNLSDATSEFFKAIGDAGLTQALTNITTTLINLTTAGGQAAAVIGFSLGQAINGLNIAIKVVSDNISFLVGGMVLIGGVAAITALGTAAKSFLLLARSVGAVGVALQLVNTIGRRNILLILAVTAAALTGALDELGKKVMELGKKLGESLAEALPEVADGTTKTIEERTAAITEMMGSTEDLQATIKPLEQTSKEVFESMRDSIIQTTQAFTTDFVNGLMSGANALDQFRNLAKNIVSQIISTFLQLAVVNQIFNAVFSPFIKGGQMAPLPTVDFFSKPAAPVAGSASGGAMSRGRPYLVGERGPELFIPHTAGTLRNGNDTRSMSGGGIIINQNITLSTGVTETVRMEVIKMLPTISEVTKGSVLEAAGRGGNFRKGLLGA